MLEIFSKNKLHSKVLLAFLLLSSTTVPFPTPLARADEIPPQIPAPVQPIIPIEPVKISFGKGEGDAITGNSLEQIISEAYKIPADELITKTPAILRTETNGKEDLGNPMQIQPETAQESLKDFELKVGTEKFNEMTKNMSPQQKNIFAGQITFARYFQMAQHTFDKFPEQTRKDLALVYYNGGPGFTGRMISFWAANNPGVDYGKVSWQTISDWISKNSSRAEDAYNLDRGRVTDWTNIVKTYVARVNLLSGPLVSRETVFTKK